MDLHRRQRVAAACMSWSLLALASASAAVAIERSPLQRAECNLGTQSDGEQQFHLLVHYPFEHALRYPGLIVGVEKSGADLVLRGAKEQPIFTPAGTPPRADQWLADLLKNQHKAMFVSHVSRSREDAEPGLVYDAYARPFPKPDEALRPGEAPTLDCERKPLAAGNVHTESWDALKVVRSELAQALQPGAYTHVLLLVMGWNTNQAEAVQNFNSLSHRLLHAAEAVNRQPAFKPFVIGVTWPSQWDSSLFEPVVRAVSLPNKANDADELAAGWLGALLRYIVAPAASAGGTPIIAIGHSFGARALTHAVCRGTRLQVPDSARGLDAPALPAGSVKLLASLQGAFSLNRFSARGAGWNVGLSYGADCPAAERLLFTASRWDTAGQVAARALGGAYFAGSAQSWNAVQTGRAYAQDGTPKFALHEADANGSVRTILGATPAPRSKFHYVNADALIRFRATGTGGGAHSDVYRLETATMLWHFIDMPAD